MNGDVISSNKIIFDGVPQGSILGPFTLILYINSLSTLEINGDLQLYADDSSIIYSTTNKLTLKREMEEDLGKIETWNKAHRRAIM